MDKLLELLEKLVRAIFGPGDEQDAGGPEPTPQAPKAEAVTGWEDTADFLARLIPTLPERD